MSTTRPHDCQICGCDHLGCPTEKPPKRCAICAICSIPAPDGLLYQIDGAFWCGTCCAAEVRRLRADADDDSPQAKMLAECLDCLSNIDISTGRAEGLLERIAVASERKP